MDCTGCGRALGGPRAARASIAVRVNGNEVIHSYYRCPACAAWTVEHYEDVFITGDTRIWRTGPLPDHEGERAAALVASCAAPQDKRCDCPAHRALYTGLPPPPRP